MSAEGGPTNGFVIFEGGLRREEEYSTVDQADRLRSRGELIYRLLPVIFRRGWGLNPRSSHINDLNYPSVVS